MLPCRHDLQPLTDTSHRARLTRMAFPRLLRDPLPVFGLAVILATVLAAVLAPELAPYPPDEQFFDGLTLEGAPLPPDAQFWLGTDLLGRDLLSRLIYGARTSLLIGVVANGVAVLLGTLLGVIAGYLPRLARCRDHALHRPDDGLPGAAAGDRAGGDLPAVLVDRGDGDRAGELGADRARGLYRDHVAGRARVHRGQPRARRRAVAASCSPTSCRTWCRPCWSGARSASPRRCCWRRRSRSSASACGRRTPSWGNIIFENQTYFATAPWLVFIPGRRDPAAGACRSTSSAMRCATRSTRPSGGAGDGALSRSAGSARRCSSCSASRWSPISCFTSCRPIRCVRSPGGSATPEVVESIRHQLGLDLPLWQQYLRYLGNLVQGDLGRSYIQKTEVATLILVAPAGDAAADGRRHRGRAADRPHRRHLGRGQSRPATSTGRVMVLSFIRRLGTAVRGRHPAALRLRGPARLVPDRRLRHLRASRPAGADPGHPRRRLVRADDPLRDDRRAAPGLHRDRAGQGRRPSADAAASTRCATPRCRSSP